MLQKFLIGFASGAVIAYLAVRARALSKSGGWAAGLLGTVVFGLAGAGWAAILLTFFVSASVLSRLFPRQKVGVAQQFAKGSRRDASQVAANGGAAGVLALLFFFLSQWANSSPWLSYLWIGFAASLAAANADTWGTEVGVLAPRKPISLMTFKRVDRGTSGAVSLTGTVAALAGSALVGAIAVLVQRIGWAPVGDLASWLVFVVITGAGFAGAFVDSLLGATWQAVYLCPVCNKETERYPVHSCGTPTVLKRGYAWLNNDWVNAACTISAGLIGLILGVILG